MTSFLTRLGSEQVILTFAGQSTPWTVALKQLTDDADLSDRLHAYAADSEHLLEPIAADLLATTGKQDDLFDYASDAPVLGAAADAAVSVPGIALAQLGALLSAADLGFKASAVSPVASLGHSQGVLAVDMVRVAHDAPDAQSARDAIVRILAVARLIGAAGARQVHLLGLDGERGTSPMMSIKGATRAQVDELIRRVANPAGPISVGVVNSRTHMVVSGHPADLAKLEQQVAKEHDRQAKLRAQKVRGGRVFDPSVEYLEVTVPFHSELMEPAVEQVAAWAAQCGLDGAQAERLARQVLTDDVDWQQQVADALAKADASKVWFVDFGPGTTAAKLTIALVDGAGAGIVSLATAADRIAAMELDGEPERLADWSAFAPRIIETAAGREVSTAFTRLTGKKPVLLAGMTPTTVDPEIVAAAANDGYWAELAGGGQVTAEVLDTHVAQLQQQLREGASVEFNAMFMDRYLWNLQFGGKRLVPRKRASGAPIDGVVVSAGIPEFDEAVKLVHTLNADGFPYVAFKPGTVDQIRQVLRIAQAVEPTHIIMEVEGGSAGGHHSWESLDDLLISTYAQVRDHRNVVLVAGGGIGTPDRAADYICGQWSARYGMPLMPVDGVLVGTAVMTAKEAHTSDQVKDLLVATPGIDPDAKDGDVFAPLGESWVPSGKERGGMTSGLSHLHADIYEIENASAKAGRLLVYLEKHPDELPARRSEVIAALAGTSKPYFGDIETMTYQQWAQRYADLCYPWVDRTFADRFLHLLHRIEARVAEQDSGEFASVFANTDAVLDAPAALATLAQAYPQAATTLVTPMDAAWFPALCREYPKPVPFVPVIDGDLLRWWGRDQLWQSEDPRYSADSVRVIPGPISVAGITTKNEPVTQILGRFTAACLERAAQDGAAESAAFAAREGAADAEMAIRRSPQISWMGHMMDNPAFGTQPGDAVYEITPADGKGSENAADSADSSDSVDSADGSALSQWNLDVHLDTHWDGEADGGTGKHAVRDIVIPLSLDAHAPYLMPVVDKTRLPRHVYAMLAATAGIGNTAITGDVLDAMPQVVEDASDEAQSHPFGHVEAHYTLSANLGPDHETVTGAALPRSLAKARIVPDALVGPAWPAIYAALGSVHDGSTPIIEGLLNAVHLDHLIRLTDDRDALAAHTGETIDLMAWAEDYVESASGRVVTIHVTHTAQDGTLLAEQTERFAIRGRAYSTDLPADAPAYGGIEADVRDTPHRLLRRVTVTAPTDMTAFARTSGDFNPIHTSRRAAAISGLAAPLVHGMWLSAVAQHAIETRDAKGNAWPILGWTYTMYGMVQLGAKVTIDVERIGRVAGAGIVLEVTCHADGELVSRGTAITRAPISAFVYPGQGIQHKGMVLDERAKSAAAREVWERADAVTRSQLGFSILAIVRDNPTDITANGVHYHHPDGLLNLTQFTQVALATVAFAQSARLREAGALIEGSYFAGHSLGEYDALSSFAGIIPLETELVLVFHRGSTMHHLIERDEQGRSNYRMGALRPNQFGVGDDGVKDYVAQVAQESGEFLEIVNYNLEGAQYAVAGTIAGLKALREDANRRAKEAGGKPAFMFVPGIDVPFHSSKLRRGVPEFRDKLDALLPQHIDYSRLEGRYIPNLVARPFEMTKDFARSILDVVPSERIKKALEKDSVWDSYAKDDQKLGRLLLTELLSWQFASPVRWIETQRLLFTPREEGGLGVTNYVEVGLGKAPTLANLGTKTLRLPRFEGLDVNVWNVGRDEARVYCTDTDSLVPQDELDAASDAASISMASGTAAASAAAASAPAATVAQPAATPGAPVAAAVPEPAPAPAAAPAADASGPAADIPFSAADGIMTLLAYESKVRPDQIGDQDTTDTLTNGVSSRRNQLLMDITGELGVPSVEGAAEATVSKLTGIVTTVAPKYHAFGDVLSAAVRERLHTLFGSAGIKPTHIAQRLQSTWGLGEGWTAFVTAAILLGTREGASSRGGDLATLPTAPVANTAEADALIDAAVQQVASEHGVAVAPLSAGAGNGGAVVDSAALDAFAGTVTGKDGVLASTARFVLGQLGLSAPKPTGDKDEDARRTVEAVETELGSGWVDQVAPRFDERKAILLDDRWASAREDLAHIYYQHDAERAALDFSGAGTAVAQQAQWYADQAKANGNKKLRDVFRRIAEQAAMSDADLAAADVEAAKKASKKHADDADVRAARRFDGDIAVVTGVSANSIAGQVVAGLLAGGATVIATSHSFRPAIVQWAKKTYRTHATRGAALWLVPANLSSYRDVDALIEWIGSEQRETHGATTTVVKPAMEPTVLFPFAAPPVHGTLADSGALFESQARLMLWSVERLIAGLSAIGADVDVDHRLHVVLPGSPNRGVFGGDGAYGEVKSAFDALVNRARPEHVWSDRVTFAHPKIGWVRGTGLMGGNDPLVKVVEKHGLTTYSTEQIADRLLDLATADSRAKAASDGPLDVDLTGGLGSEPLDIRALRAEAEADAAVEAAKNADSDDSADSAANAAVAKPALIKALPTPRVPRQPGVDLVEWQGVTARPEDEVVIVSIGELGPWGSGRTRFEAELGIHSDGTVKLSAMGVLELAWNMGLVSWQDNPQPGWVDADGEPIAEEDIADRYRDEVIARSGIRPFTDAMGVTYADGTDEESAEVFLDHDVTFSVASLQVADEYVAADPAHTRIGRDEETGEWTVTRTKGASAFVPRRATMTRTVGGQFPDGFDPTRWGIPASMVGDVDPIALWNIVTTVDAFLSAGFSPTELLQAVHPSQVASTQGTGFGGMHSMRQLYVDRYLNKEYPSDILQEALPNVVAAHVMQSYVGGYGVMVQPVSACATAAVSIEEGFDKIRLGKADFVVAGAIDDIGVESVNGFGYMNATANSQEMAAKGIDPRFFSRANDRRRGGFIESQGGGTVLLTRGDIALRLGLPVAGVVGYVRSFADGAHTSIPAPGLGALAAAQGGKDSRLVRDLAALGVTPDDIAVVSKHDTSTNANDPNESELHNTIEHAIGRTPGNPLYVVSQKSLTGHAKGGACVFQVDGLTQLFASGIVPANASLDCVDPKLERDDFMVWLREPLDLRGGAGGAADGADGDADGAGHTGHTVKAGLATSLGFGHVSGFVALVHPGAFEASVARTAGEQALADWRKRANERLAKGAARLEAGMLGHAPLFEPVDGRHLREDDPHYDGHEVEKAMLLNPDARLGADGYYD
jgi:fatty acid synthase